MKRTLLFFITLMLPIGLLCSCKDGKQNTGGNETNDSISTTNTPLPESEDQETPDEGMEIPSGMFAPKEVRKLWKTQTISVPGQKNDIVALFEAFYTEWPTLEGSRIVNETNPSLVHNNDFYEEGSVIDRKNGYVESAWYEGEDLGTVSACVWNRKNGHKLFAVNFHSEQDFLCFYDFDPAKRTLTPEESPLKQEHQNNSGKNSIWYTLPQKGKTLEVIEFTGEEEMAITYYNFDGQNLKFAGHGD